MHNPLAHAAIAWPFLLALSALSVRADDPAKAKAAQTDSLGQPLPPGAIARFGSVRVWTGEVGAVAFSPDGKILAASVGPSIQLWDVATGKPRQRLTVVTKSVQALAFSPDGKLLASCAEGETKTIPGPVFDDQGNVVGKDAAVATGAVIWDVATGTKIRDLDTGGRSLAFSVDGKHLVVADRVGAWWNTTTWQRVPLPGGSAVDRKTGGQLSTVALSADGNHLGVACFGQTVQILNLKNQEVKIIPAQLPDCAFVTFTADSQQLATGGGDYFRLWNLATGKEYQPFGGVHAQRIVMAPKSSMVAWLERSRDASVYLGDLATEKMAKPLRGHSSSATCLAFSPDGKILASGSRDGTVLLWDVAAQKLLAPQEAQAERFIGRDDRPTVPADAKVAIVLDKQEYFLGENILVHFIVENTGQALFSINMGGDYRGAARALRFKVTATAQDGKQAADPNPSDQCFGGLSHSPELKPGDKYYQSLQLRRYCRLEKTGTYTLRIAHDLGWRVTPERKIPVAEIKLKVLMPDAKQARAVVEEMYRLPKDHGGSAGHKREPFADFGALRYAVYLPWLTPRAADGDAEALAAIGCIATPEATQGLIDLAQHKDAKFARSALQTLNERLPDPQLEGKLGKRNPFFNDWAEPRRWLIAQAWKPEFAPTVRRLAGKLLQEKDIESLRCGGYILQCLGEKDDLPALMRGLEIAVAHAKEHPPEEGIYPRPRGACTELLRAATVMIQRGVDPPPAPRSPGERILFAQAVQQRQDFRPADWEATYAALLQDDWPFVRQVGLDCLPAAPAKPLTQLLPKLLLDADVDVQIAACHVAGKVETPELRKPLLQVLATAKEDWLLRAAGGAAQEDFIPRIQYIRIFVQRLDENGMSDKCLDHLTFLVKNYSGRHGPRPLTLAEAQACKQSWEQFVRAHEKELTQGRTYAANDPEVPIRDLFPKTEFYPAGR